MKDANKLSTRDTRLCVAKLVQAMQEVNFHGDVKIRFRMGELFHIEMTQSALPRDILNDRFLCVLLRSVENEAEKT